MIYLYITLLSSLVLSTTYKPETKQPNILYIMSDDHAAHAISAYGTLYKDYFSTPNIDRIANEGMRLNRVYSTNAICGPSRATILSGKYSHKNGYVKNYYGGEFDSSQWTFIKELQSNGYQTALFGKWHLASEPAGFDYYKYHNNKGQQGTYYDPVYNDNGKNVTEIGYATNLTTDFTLDWLKNKRKEEKPFAALLHFKAPHRPWQRDEKYLDLFEGIEMPYPENFEDDYKGREQTAGDTWMTMDYLARRDAKIIPPDSITNEKALREWMMYGFKPGEAWMPKGIETVEEARKWKYQRYIKDYLACVKSIDDNIGRVLDYLDKSGLAENTIVVYTADQGFYLGEHGWFDKRFMYEESSKMPFVTRYPKTIKPGSESDRIITNTDFAPTLLDLAGIGSPDEVQGESFASILRGETSSDWRDSYYYHYYEYPLWHHVKPHYGIRNNRYKLIHFYYKMDVWEFYDLKKDPQELKNLIDKKKYAAIIEEMKQDIKNHQETLDMDTSKEAMYKLTEKHFGGHQ